jgi:hypothetical protein
LQDPPKFIQIGIFGLKKCHLANLIKKPNLQPTTIDSFLISRFNML